MLRAAIFALLLVGVASSSSDCKALPDINILGRDLYRRPSLHKFLPDGTPDTDYFFNVTAADAADCCEQCKTMKHIDRGPSYKYLDDENKRACNYAVWHAATSQCVLKAYTNFTEQTLQLQNKPGFIALATEDWSPEQLYPPSNPTCTFKEGVAITEDEDIGWFVVTMANRDVESSFTTAKSVCGDGCDVFETPIASADECCSACWSFNFAPAGSTSNWSCEEAPDGRCSAFQTSPNPKSWSAKCSAFSWDSSSQACYFKTGGAQSLDDATANEGYVSGALDL